MGFHALTGKKRRSARVRAKAARKAADSILRGEKARRFRTL
jgi:hypothetical protein